MRVETIESKLDKDGIAWQYLSSLSLNTIDRAASKANHARFEARSEELVEEYARHMLTGDEFPPIVIWQQEPQKAFLVIDGNHRVWAADRINRLSLDAYQVLVDDVYVIERLTRSWNTSNGQKLSRDEIDNHIIYLCEKYHRPQKELAELYRLHPDYVSKLLARHRQSARIASWGLPAERLTHENVALLASIDNDNVARAAASLMAKGSLGNKDARDLASAIKMERTEADQIASVSLFAERPDIRNRIAEPGPRKGRASRQVRRDRLFLVMSQMAMHIERFPTLEANQVTTQNDRCRVEEFWRRIERLMGEMLG